jgi:hypothetical protein
LIWSLQKNRYAYRSGRRMMEKQERRRMESDALRGAQRFYGRLVSTLSKHDVLIRDLSQLPRFKSGYVRTIGVYGGRQC